MWPPHGNGRTETTSAIFINSGSDYFADTDDVCGPPIGAEVRIVEDPFGALRRRSPIGDVWVRGPSVIGVVDLYHGVSAGSGELTEFATTRRARCAVPEGDLDRDELLTGTVTDDLLERHLCDELVGSDRLAPA